jgi:hypothetical protein
MVEKNQFKCNRTAVKIVKLCPPHSTQQPSTAPHHDKRRCCDVKAKQGWGKRRTVGLQRMQWYYSIVALLCCWNYSRTLAGFSMTNSAVKWTNMKPVLPLGPSWNSNSELRGEEEGGGGGGGAGACMTPCTTKRRVWPINCPKVFYLASRFNTLAADRFHVHPQSK